MKLEMLNKEKSVGLNSFWNEDKLIRFFLMVFLIFYVAVFCWASYDKIIFPYRLGHGEVSVLFETYLLANGKNLYPDLGSPPYIATLYTPMYYLLTAPLIKIFGVSYVPGRMLSILFTVLVTVGLFLTVKRLTKNTWVAWLTALIPFASHFFYSWAPLARGVDMLGLFFTFWALYFALQKKDITAVSFMIMAIMSKQSFIALPAAFFCHRFLFEDRKKTIILGMIFIGVLGLLVWVINVLSHGWFIKHTSFASAHGFNLGMLLGFKYKLIIMYPVIIAFALFTLYDTMKKKEISILHFYFATATLTSLTIGFGGATFNYHLELFVLLVLLFGLGLNSMVSFWKERGSSIFYMLVIVQLMMLFHLPNLPDNIQRLYFFYHFTPPPSEEEFRACKKISRYVKDSPGEVLSLTNGDFCLVNGKEMVVESEFFLREDLGLWDSTNLANSIANQEYSLIITRERLSEMRWLSSEVIEKIKNNYDNVDEVSFVTKLELTRGGAAFHHFHYNIFKPSILKLTE